MKSMSSKEIKDRYGAFAEAARREPVVHTSHGRPTLVTISIDRARSLPGFFAFGSDGGDELYVFDLRKDDGAPVCSVSAKSGSVTELSPITNSFSEFLEGIVMMGAS